MISKGQGPTASVTSQTIKLSTKLSTLAIAVAIAVAAGSVQPVAAQDASSSASGSVEEVVVLARRREESVQDVPIPVSVISGDLVADTNSFTVNRIKELVPTVQLYSSNPRNTAVNIRGLGAPYGLTNDGIEPGVGFYVDGVFYARPAAQALDFIDVQQVEVLRGPQGTLFGKNTTAGAIIVTSRKPSREAGATFEVGAGNEGFVQAKASVTGPLGEKFAGRFSLVSTQRDGDLYNVRTNEHVNELDNLGWRAQLLFEASDRVTLTATLDDSRQDPNGYAQGFAGVVPTLRPANRQFEQIIRDLNYQPVSRNPFDRLIDTDTPWRAKNELGGASVNIDIQVGPGTLTSTTAWRYWNWAPSNDRDYLGLPVGTLSQATSTQDQTSQEIRWAGELGKRVSGVFGFFAFDQTIKSDPVQIEQLGSAAYRFLVAPGTAGATPQLYDGYGSAITSRLDAQSAALFANIDWAITDRFHIQPGIRYNYDAKDENFNRSVYGGPANPTAQQQALLLAVYRPQAFAVDVDDTNTSGNLTFSFQANDKINAYATYATAFKSVGLNLGGLPLDAQNQTILSSAVVKPEDATNIEIGLKTSPTARSTVNFTLYNTSIDDYQTNVFNSQLGVARGYLANAEKVRVRGAELDSNFQIGTAVSLHAALAYSDGEYVTFKDAPPPLEETGGPTSKDISGGVLPGLSKWAATFGGEYATPMKHFGGAELFTGFDVYYRDDFSSSPSPSKYLNIEGYSLLNLRVGFRASRWSGYLWTRNALDEQYYEQLLAAPAGNGAGHYGAVLGDARTYGVTFRYSLD